MYYDMKQYKLHGFERSRSKGKKYDAIIINKQTNRSTRIPFGAIGYQQYRDSTGLGFYSRYNHNDRERRTRYRKRHVGHIKKGFYSPSWMSYKYLW